MSDKNSPSNPIAVYGSLLYFSADPMTHGEKACHHHSKGMLLIENGRITYVGSRSMGPKPPLGSTIFDYGEKLILPGFVDTHLHPPQHGVIASNSTELLHWLDTYTFPEEGRFSDPAHCEKAAKAFFDELLTHGTTTLLAMATVHSSSAEALFKEAHRRNIRLITGKTLMDRNAPDYLTDTPQSAYDESLSLIRKWHGKGRLAYGVTPRFAVSSTREQLEECGALLQKSPGLYLHTHLSENHQEIKTVKELFPEANDYLDVYDRYGLVKERSIFAHAIHLSEPEFARLKESRAAISFCPSSNLFLGSGLFRLKKAREYDIPVGLGSDIGGGTSFSPFHTMAEGFKVCQLLKEPISAMGTFYLATLGGAISLGLEKEVGTFAPGLEGDFVVIDPKATPLSAMRTDRCKSIEELLFVLMILGDERFVSATHVMGEQVMTKRPF